MTELLHRPWPWYVTGPLLGLVAVSLLAIGNKPFGVSSNLRHIWAACLPGNVAYFKYDWRRDGLWNLVFILGVVAGGFVGGVLLANPHPVATTPAAGTSLAKLGIHDFSGLVPRELFTLHMLLTPRGFLMFIGGGFLIGFGTAYAGGCTSGHGITGLAALQLPSLLTVISFFAAGAAASFFVLPLLVPR
ncbi:MAG: YeeE/YedE family protein [Bacillati bacterium ANGP1]|uniref:YeeE/YedE family protein n=1 Tax=Candidatus Segetimicrobium genomatis TaxID=2569760 RepID=A0A537IKI7_9BACT|nr:MAG: YeeE/YedE family protein [Terrabacteria group bacterium ANGP1]